MYVRMAALAALAAMARWQIFDFEPEQEDGLPPVTTSMFRKGHSKATRAAPLCVHLLEQTVGPSRTASRADDIR